MPDKFVVRFSGGNSHRSAEFAWLSRRTPQVMLFDGLTVVANPRRLLSEPSFKAFVSPIVDERGTFGEGQDLEALIMEVGIDTCRATLRRSNVGLINMPASTGKSTLPCSAFVTEDLTLFLCFVFQPPGLGLPGDVGGHPPEHSPLLSTHRSIRLVLRHTHAVLLGEFQVCSRSFCQV